MAADNTNKPNRDWLTHPQPKTPEQFRKHRELVRSVPIDAPAAKLRQANEEQHNDPVKDDVRGWCVRQFLLEPKEFLLPRVDKAAEWGEGRDELLRVLATAKGERKEEVQQEINALDEKDPFSEQSLTDFIARVKKQLPGELVASLDELRAIYAYQVTKVRKAEGDENANKLKAWMDQDLRDRKEMITPDASGTSKQSRAFDKECAKVAEVLAAAKNGQLLNGKTGSLNLNENGIKPDLCTNESQLLWGAALTYMHTHNQLQNLLQSTFRRSCETHPIFKMITEDPRMVGMAQSCAREAGMFIQDANARIRFGAPGTHFYQAGNNINLDLGKSMIFGVMSVPSIGGDYRYHAMVEPIIAHEIAHKLYSIKYTPRMNAIWEELKELGKEGGLKLSDKGSMQEDVDSNAAGFSKEQYIKFTALYSEWQALHGLWNALEDHAMNQHAVRLRVEEGRPRYPLDMPRLLQLSIGMLKGFGTGKGIQPPDPLPTDPMKLAGARFSALSNASLYSYYADTLHVLPPGEKTLRAFGVPKGVFDTEGYDEASVMKTIEEASQQLQLDGLPSHGDEFKPEWMKRREESAPSGQTLIEHINGTREVTNDIRNKAIESVFDIAEAIALPDLRKFWEIKAEESLSKKGGKDRGKGGGIRIRMKDLPSGPTPGSNPSANDPTEVSASDGINMQEGSEEHINGQYNHRDLPSDPDHKTYQPHPEIAPLPPTTPQSPPTHVHTIEAKGRPPSIGRKELNFLAAAKFYSDYSVKNEYKELVKEVAEELKSAVRNHWTTIRGRASEYGNVVKPRFSAQPDRSGVTNRDVGRWTRERAKRDAGMRANDRVFERDVDIPSAMTHHLIMQLDGTPSMGTSVDGADVPKEERRSRQKMAAKLAILMEDAVSLANTDLMGENNGVPAVTCTIIEWGNANPHVCISSATEQNMSPEVRNNKLDQLATGMNCSGTFFEPAPAVGFNHLRSAEMLAFQSGPPGSKEPTVATINTVVLSDGGIHDDKNPAGVLAAMAHHENAGVHAVLFGHESDRLSQAIWDAHDSDQFPDKHLRGTPVVEDWDNNNPDNDLNFANNMLRVITQGIAHPPEVAPLSLSNHVGALDRSIEAMLEYTHQDLGEPPTQTANALKPRSSTTSRSFP